MNVIPCEMPMRLIDCPPGLFIFGIDTDSPCVGFKTEYGCHNEGDMEVYVVESGESFWGGTSVRSALAGLHVVPAKIDNSGKQSNG